MINIPGGCLREPYAWLHHGGAIERARNFLGAPWPVLVPLALRISFSMKCCMIRLTELCSPTIPVQC